MVADGLWDKAPHPEVVFGQHVWPGRAGQVEVTSGPAMAMADSWRVTVQGRGGHGSQPPAVVTVASFHAGLKENIIPSEAVFTVNVRTLDPRVRERLLGALRRVLLAEAQASGAPEPTIEELYTFPLMHNDPAATTALTAALREVLGQDDVLEVPARMGSEDFGHLPGAIGVPGVYWFFGGLPAEVVNGDDPVPSNHSPHFAPVLEPTLTTGVTAAWTALVSRLGKHV